MVHSAVPYRAPLFSPPYRSQRVLHLRFKYLVEVDYCGCPMEISSEIVLVVLLKRYFY